MYASCIARIALPACTHFPTPRAPLAPPADGVRIVLKAMGKEPFASGRGATNIETVATDEQVAECRWGYQCSVCLLAGDLLCCEVRGPGGAGCRVGEREECIQR